MKYRNTKTGAILELSGQLSGGDWVEVKASAPTATTAPAQEKKQRKTVAKEKS